VHALLVAPACPRMTTLPVHPALRAAAPCEGAAGRAALPLLRFRALDLLRFALGGDALAAEYALMAALSRVFTRSEGQPHGMLSLNLTGCPPVSPSATAAAAAPAAAAAATAATAATTPPPAAAAAAASPAAAALHTALAALLPHAALLPVCLPELNAGHWAPRKDNASGRLARGRLQLAAGTVAVLDEGGLSAGRLEESGVSALRALESVLREQQLPCDFEFYTGNFAVDLPLVVVGEGRSLLRHAVDVELPLRPDPAAVAAAMAALSGLSSAGTAPPPPPSLAASRAATPASLGGSPGAAASPPAATASPPTAAAVAAAAQANAPAANASSPLFPSRDAVRLAAATTPDLDAVRDHLAAARSSDCVLPADLADDLAGRFVELHRADPQAFGPKEFSRRVTLAKLLALSGGESVLGLGSWERAGAMEAERAARVKAAAAGGPAGGARLAAAAAAAGKGQMPGAARPPAGPSAGGAK
jgi:hypothetical protein